MQHTYIYDKERKDERKTGQRGTRTRGQRERINEDGTSKDTTTEDLFLNKTVPVNNEGQRVTSKIRTAMFGEPEEVRGPLDPVYNANRKGILKMGPAMFGEPEEVMAQFTQCTMQTGEQQRKDKIRNCWRMNLSYLVT